MRERRDRFVGTRRPLSRQTIRLNPYSHRRCAVARPMPKRQQIGFHGVPSARSHTSRASSGSSQVSHGSAASIRLIAAADGGGSRIGSGVWSTRSPNSTNIAGQVLK